jgi:epoxide hydrolase
MDLSPTQRGWGLPRIARAWSVLMRRLGYTDYLAQGGDWGAGVTTWMAKQHVEGLAAIHLNLPILFPPPVEGEPNQAEKATIAQLVAFNDKKSGYAKIQSTRPQTIGYALADSPAGQWPTHHKLSHRTGVLACDRRPFRHIGA